MRNFLNFSFKLFFKFLNFEQKWKKKNLFKYLFFYFSLTNKVWSGSAPYKIRDSDPLQIDLESPHCFQPWYYCTVYMANKKLTGTSKELCHFPQLGKLDDLYMYIVYIVFPVTYRLFFIFMCQILALIKGFNYDPTFHFHLLKLFSLWFRDFLISFKKKKAVFWVWTISWLGWFLGLTPFLIPGMFWMFSFWVVSSWYL